jgi:uncharacterized protein with HEPN domain
MSRRGDTELLKDILECIDRLKEYSTNLSYDEFMSRRQIQDSIIRNLEIIGEASKNISEIIKQKYTNLDWKKMASLRDRLIHEYFGISHDVVWGIVQEEIPTLEIDIKNILNNETT